MNSTTKSLTTSRRLLRSYSRSLPSYSLYRSYSEVKCNRTIDNRTRLSKVWVPTGGIAESSDEDSHSKLIRAGYLRQAHSGIFHMLPLGRRVQDKLEALIDKHMSSLGASKLALSSISSEALWEKSGRLTGAGSELFRFKDRKLANYLLSPTHEEEITSLVLGTVKSYKHLPVRLYQISRKYRDELRPRQGLLRSREFIMKDLYTFDYSPSLALETYYDVRAAYVRLFNELKIPYLVADADSGSIGGDLSHEFHFPTLKGEDNVISCDNCDYVANEELAECAIPAHRTSGKPVSSELLSNPGFRVWRGITQDRETLVNVWYSTMSPSGTEINPEINVHAIKAIVPGLDASIEDPLPLWKKHELIHTNSVSTKPKQTTMLNLVDSRISVSLLGAIQSRNTELPFWPKSMIDGMAGVNSKVIVHNRATRRPLNLLKIRDGDSCVRCSDGKFKVQKAIELGHTFHLGTRYSEPMEAFVTVPKTLLEAETELLHPDQVASTSTTSQIPMQMGCHGIGVSRIIGAVADTLADEKGLNWPRVMAPYEVIVVPAKGNDEAALEVYDALSSIQTSADHTPLDLILDDREQAFPWKMGDADLIGYPVVVVVGRKWKTERVCEIQCRRLEVHQDVFIDELPAFVQSLLSQL